MKPFAANLHPTAMSEIRIKIEGMHCGACVRRVNSAVAALEGVSVIETQVGALRIQLLDPAATVEPVLAAVNALGFQASVAE